MGLLRGTVVCTTAGDGMRYESLLTCEQEAGISKYCDETLSDDGSERGSVVQLTSYFTHSLKPYELNGGAIKAHHAADD